MTRRAHLIQFYALLDELERRIGGTRTLAECSGRMDWPKRGVYFFYEAGEHRTDSGSGSRIVRVGTHALSTGSRATLWSRLAQHRGPVSTGCGNHRGSIFRLLVGTSLKNRYGYQYPHWGVGSSAPRTVVISERPLEFEVSQIIRHMPFLWLPVDDDVGPKSARGFIERNALALLSNYDESLLDAPSPQWLGHHCDRDLVRCSGLWNQNHVTGAYDPAFLDALEHWITQRP